MEQNNIKTEVSSLREKYNQLFQEKEDLASKKTSVGDKIKKTISQVKKSKNSRSEANAKIKNLKKERDSRHAQIKDLGGEIKDMNPRRGPRDRKTNSPSFLKKKIEELQTKLETEALPFNKEKVLSKEIKDLKKEYAKVAKIEDAKSESREKSGNISQLRKEAQTLHEQIQKLADESEKYHQEVVSLSKDVDELKLEEDKVAEEFKIKKSECLELGKELKINLGKVNLADRETSRKKETMRKAAKKKREDKIQKQVEEKGEEAEKKIKKGGTLTMDDLLALQAKIDKEEEVKSD